MIQVLAQEVKNSGSALQSQELSCSVDIANKKVQDQAPVQEMDLTDVGLWPDHITDSL